MARHPQDVDRNPGAQMNAPIPTMAVVEATAAEHPADPNIAWPVLKRHTL